MVKKVIKRHSWGSSLKVATFLLYTLLLCGFSALHARILVHEGCSVSVPDDWKVDEKPSRLPLAYKGALPPEDYGNEIVVVPDEDSSHREIIIGRLNFPFALMVDQNSFNYFSNTNPIKVHRLLNSSVSELIRLGFDGQIRFPKGKGIKEAEPIVLPNLKALKFEFLVKDSNVPDPRDIYVSLFLFPIGCGWFSDGSIGYLVLSSQAGPPQEDKLFQDLLLSVKEVQ